MKIPVNAARACTAACIVVFLSACGGGGTMPQSAAAHTATSAVSRAPRYKLVILPGGLVPEAMNDAGTVVGIDQNTSHGFVFQRGRATELPVLPGDSSGDAHDVNNRGQIVGYSIGDSDLVPCQFFNGECPVQHAVVYENGSITKLQAVPDPNGAPGIVNVADKINNGGEIAGESGFPHDLAKLAQLVIFRPAPAHNITFDGFVVYGTPLDMNDGGEIVGAAETIWAGSPSGLFAYPKQIVCNPALPVPGNAIVAINNAGTVTSFSADGTPVYCRNGVTASIQLYPSGINERGEIVGFATASQTMIYARGHLHPMSRGVRYGNLYVSNDRSVRGQVVSISYGDAVLYSNGTLYDLNDLVPNHPGIVLQGAAIINARGDIAGAYVNTANFSLVGYLLLRQ